MSLATEMANVSKEVYADSEMEALEEARRMAEDDLSIDIIDEEEEGIEE